MKHLWIGLLILFTFTGIWAPNCSIAQQERSNGEGKVHLQWAFAALKEGPSGPQLVAIHRDTALTAGDQFKMLLEFKEKCFAYVIYQGPQGEMRLLFPYALSDFEKGFDESAPYYIPKGHGWFELDDEKDPMAFHLIASAERLRKLETLLKKYESARNDERQNAARELLAEIQGLQRLNRSLKAPAERPVQIVGRTRGTGEAAPTDRNDIRSLAVEISAEKFFSRTFTIDHK